MQARQETVEASAVTSSHGGLDISDQEPGADGTNPTVAACFSHHPLYRWLVNCRSGWPETARGERALPLELLPAGRVTVAPIVRSCARVIAGRTALNAVEADACANYVRCCLSTRGSGSSDN